MDPEQRGCEDVERIHVAQDRIMWQVPVITVTNIQVFLHVFVTFGDYPTLSQEV
jgi:hypothetical protein